MASLADDDDTTRTVPAASPEAQPRGLNLVTLCALAFDLGIATGIGAVVFRDLTGFIHNLAFLGRPQVRYDANVFTPPPPWGAFVILVPVIGAVIVTLYGGGGRRRPHPTPA